MNLKEFQEKYPNVNLEDLYSLTEIKSNIPVHYLWFLDYIREKASGSSVVHISRFYPTANDNKGLREKYLDEAACIYQLKKDGHIVENTYYSGNGFHNGFKIYLK